MSAYVAPRGPARAARRGAGARPAAGQPPRERPLPDRLHRDQRRLPGGPGAPRVPDRLPLRRAGEGGGAGLRPGPRPRGPARVGARARARAAMGARAGAPRLRRCPHDRARPREARRAGGRRRRARAAPAGSWRTCAPSRTRGSWRRSGPPGDRRRPLPLADRRARPGRPHRARGRAWRSSGRPRTSAPTASPSRRSWPPAANGALPHATPRRDVAIPRDTLVVVDLGCMLDGYCSDCTRTFATGEIDAEAREGYELVRTAQAAALAATRPGAECGRSTRGARAIAAAGRGDQFGHGLGHGVGLEVHEAPRLAPSATGSLEAGNVVTSSPASTCPAVRRPDRGPGPGDRGRPRGADADPQGADRRLVENAANRWQLPAARPGLVMGR